MEIQAEQKLLKDIREYFKNTMDKSGYDKDMVNLLELSIDEVCQNILRHGYPEGMGDIKLHVDFNDEKVVITITDHARPFDLNKYDPIGKEELVDREIKGKLGISIIKKICDEIHYKSEAGTNRTVLVKYNKNEKNYT